MYRISQIAEKTGLSIATLRYYESLSLITPCRDKNNYRLYSDDDLAWIEFIMRLKQTGMELSLMQKYAQLRNKGDSTIPSRLILLDQQREKLLSEKELINTHLAFIDDKKNYYHTQLNKKKKRPGHKS